MKIIIEKLVSKHMSTFHVPKPHNASQSPQKLGASAMKISKIQIVEYEYSEYPK